MRRLNSMFVPALGILVLLGAVAACTWQGLQPEEDGPRRLYLAGDLAHTDDDRIVDIASNYLDADFFDLDIDRLRDALVALPWVAEARVHRRWPNGVVVRVREHRPVALWGETGVLADDGSLFLPPADERPADLPVLTGPESDRVRLRRMLASLQERLEPAGLDIERLSLDARGSWTAVLANGRAGGLELRLGRTQVETRLARFAAYGPGALGESLNAAGYVDLRYVDGFAVGGGAL